MSCGFMGVAGNVAAIACSEFKANNDQSSVIQRVVFSRLMEQSRSVAFITSKQLLWGTNT
jgi:hypothetical protein